MRLHMPALRKRYLTVALALGAPVAVAAAVAVPQMASAAPSATPHETTVTYWVTMYGWTDNSPPGPQIAHSGCKTPGGQTINAANYKGEAGTYNDPVVYADPQHLNGPWCQLIYVPYLKKYFEHADQCNPCGGQNSKHFDLWMGGDKNSTKQPENKALLSCENKWTETNTLFMSPPKNLPVDTTPMFTPPTTCHGGAGDGTGGGS